MISILLTILKILGIFLLVVLGIILVLVSLVLFVPVRYRITACRKTEEEPQMAAKFKVTWLFHILNAAFSYPEAAYVNVRVFGFTVFRSDKPDTRKNASSKTEYESPESKADEIKTDQNESMHKSSEKQSKCAENEQSEWEEHEKYEDEPKATLSDFLRKLWTILKNIKYTITKICDKIKHIIKNTKYYIRILKSNTFQRAWNVCSAQVFSLLKSILPDKVRGNILIGTGDPASTGQVLSIYGMLYPLLGNHINITPDFEQQVMEGELFIKGKITGFKVLKTAAIIYFNRDLRRLIKLFKREAA